MNEFNFTYHGPYNSKEPFTLNHIKRYTNAKHFNASRTDEADIPESSDYSFIFTTSGNTTVKNSDNTYLIPENSFLIYKPQGKQIYTQHSGSSLVICFFSGKHVQNILDSLNLECGMVYTLSPQYVSVDDILYFDRQLEVILDEYHTKKPYYSQKISGMFYSYLVDCARHIKLYNDNNTTTNIQHIVKYIQNHIESPLDIEQLAKMSHLSRSRFYHVFKQHTGMSPISFQNNLRTTVAKDYLVFHPEMSISYIASRIGFNDPLYFSKLFKKEYGMSPSQYRKELEKKNK